MPNRSATHIFAYLYLFFSIHLIYVLAVQKELLQTSLFFSTLISISFLALLLIASIIVSGQIASNYSSSIAKIILSFPILKTLLILLALASTLPNLIIHFELSWLPHLERLSSLLCAVVIIATIPYLHRLLKLLHPKFLIYHLSKKIISYIYLLEDNPKDEKLHNKIITHLEGLTDAAMMAKKKHDILLLRLVLDNCFKILSVMAQNYVSGSIRWRERSHILNDHKRMEEDSGHVLLWPEVHILSKLNAAMVDFDDSSALNALCIHMQKLLKSCAEAKKEAMTQLLLISFNSFMSSTISKKNSDHFNLVSYYYCKGLIEVIYSPKSFQMASSDLMQFYQQLLSNKMMPSFQIAMHDVSQTIIQIAAKNHETASQFLKNNLFPMLKRSLKNNRALKGEIEKCLVKIYWEARVRNYNKLHEFIINNYLIDKETHLNTLKVLHSSRTPIFRIFSGQNNLSAPLSKDAEQLSLHFITQANS